MGARPGWVSYPGVMETSMNTFPLAIAVRFLRQHGVADVLEGAPKVDPNPSPFHVSALTMRAIREIEGASSGYVRDLLYLGSDAACPAALGWVTAALALAKGKKLRDVAGILDREHVVHMIGYDAGADSYDVVHVWAWGSWPNKAAPVTILPGPTPATPAACLAAVLAHELKP